MKTIIAGSRTIADYSAVTEAMALCGWTPSEVVSGCAAGVDSLAIRWATERDIPVAKSPAQWESYGKSAGSIRNKEMAVYADALVAIWDGKSRGTKNMIDTATRLGLKIFVHRISDEIPRPQNQKETYGL